MQHLRVDITLINDRNATVAAAVLTDAGAPLIETTGSAKREPGDPYDRGIANGLAAGRALEKLGRHLQRSAGIWVREAERRRERTEVRAAMRRGRRIPLRRRLPVEEIRSLYGEDAAKRAQARRSVTA